MNKTQDPLFFSEVPCPVCKTANKYENIRTGSYSETGRDTDFMPTGRTWLNQAYQKYDPLLFFMATCSKCFYTRELNKEYKSWQNDTSFKTYRLKSIQQKHLSDLSDKKGIVQFLGKHLNQNKYPFETAVIKFLLGIYDLKLLERPSNLDIGRYFLRIGWLFRGKGAHDGSGGSGMSGFFQQLRGAAQVANQMLPGYDDKVSNLKKLISNDFSQAFSDIPEAEQHKQQMEQILNDISGSLEPIVKANQKLLEAFNSAEKALTGNVSNPEDKFFEYAGFQSFLSEANTKWNEVPMNEKDALRKAAEYYKKAYETSGEISQGIQQVQAAYLIAELTRRIGERDESNQFFNQTIKMGRDIVMGKKADNSTINYTQKLLEMAMEQARLNKKEVEGAAS